MAEDKPIEANEPSSAPLVPEADQVPVVEAKESVADSQEATEVPTPDDPELDEAVDDITAKESDEVLAAEDAVAKAFEPDEPPQGLRAKIKLLAKRWWNNRKVRYLTLVGLTLLIILLFAIPPSRYFMLNNVGVRASASMTVLDDSTGQPLKNVKVRLANQTAITSNNGQVKLQHLKLGSSNLQIERRAFAVINHKTTVGWGSNPLGSFKLRPTGSQYSFSLKDFLSGKPITNAEASSGEADANADDKGQILLTIDPKDSNDSLSVKISAKGYRTENIQLNLDDKSAHDVAMVPGQKHVFVSRKSGKYDLYSIYADGKDQKLLLAATGAERSDIAVIPSPSSNLVAVVSTRDNLHDNQGYLMSTLSLIDSSTGQNTAITSSQRIQVLGWIGKRLVYVQVAAGASAANPNRQRLISYDSESNQKTELASSNYFNDVTIAKGSIYYSPSDSYRAGTVGLYRINPDNTDRQTLFNKQVWSLYRDKYDHFNLPVADNNWMQFSLGGGQASKSGAPASQQSRLYQDSPDGKQSLWVDNRDGKGVLLAYNLSSKTDKTLVSQSGLTMPLYWLNNNYVIYRVQTDQETADYVFNLDGGSPRKIANVTNSSGVAQWYY